MAAIIRSAAVSGEPRPLRRITPPSLAGRTAHSGSEDGGAVAQVQSAPRQADDAQAAQHVMQALQAEHDTALHAMRQQEMLLQQARQQLNDDAATVLADAERRGLALGQEKGEAEARTMVGAQVERWSHLIANLTQARRQLLAEAEDMMVEIAFAAVCRIVGPALGTPAGVAAMVRGLLHDTREPEQLSVRLHPDDVRLLSAADDSMIARLNLQADAGVKLGGCLVEGPHGTLDARLDLQIRRLADALLRARLERDDAEASV